jgi:hypothetical protein
MRFRTAAFGLLLSIGPAWAQATSAPVTVAEVIEICAPVIAREYEGDNSQWGTCTKATWRFVRFVYGANSPIDPKLAVDELALQLALLHRPADCRKYLTEVPEALSKPFQVTAVRDLGARIFGFQRSIMACRAIAPKS